MSGGWYNGVVTRVAGGLGGGVGVAGGEDVAGGVGGPDEEGATGVDGGSGTSRAHRW